MDLTDILPFRFLSFEGRRRLDDLATFKDWPAGRVLGRQGDLTDRRVFLLTEGTVDVIDHRKGPDTRTGQIEAGHWFGERPALFHTARAVEFRANTDCRAAILEGADFVELIRSEPRLAHALTFVLRDKHAVFTDFTRFVDEVKLGASRGHLVIEKLLPVYRRLRPALHRFCNDRAIDFTALTYALARLPSNVSRTFVWFVTDDCPPHYALAAPKLFEDVTARARRRMTWEMIPGKSLILLRDGLSDLLDLATLLCIYAVEVRKIRRRLRNARVMCALSTEAAEAILAPLFSPDERAQLERLWPGEVPRRLMELSVHHEDITIHSYKRTNNYNSAHAETWTAQIAAATEELIGIAPRDLGEDVPVHIISSNTHSVTNCLSPWLAENADRLRQWGAVHEPQLVASDWHDPQDLLVALSRPFFKAHPEAAVERAERDRSIGVKLTETAFTGIGVELFDLSTLRSDGTPGLLVNIDYAFGQQAEPIIAHLIHLFGRRIRSINVLGKAGGLEGERGDVIVCDGFVSQFDDVLQCPPITVDTERLRARLPGREVRTGRVLTVLGTVLQNDRLLHTYHKLWGCVGLEMEGSFYCRQVMESQALGLLGDIELRFLYYISDLPLQHDASLAAKLSPAEGIPPLYAITREVLREIQGT